MLIFKSDMNLFSVLMNLQVTEAFKDSCLENANYAELYFG